MELEQWEHSGLILEGVSLAGVRSCITIPQFSVAFDIANGPSHALAMSTFLITHGHMDHAAGIPYIISQKAMNSHRPPRFVMPEEMIGPMKEIMRQWSKIEGHEYNYELIGVKANPDIPLKPNFFVRTFPTIHRVPSLGYSIYRKFRKLRADLQGLRGEEIAGVRSRGEDPTEERKELLISYTGDTQVEFLDKSPEVRASKILMMEATYLDERKTVTSAKEWGHTHLDELIPRFKSITSEKIVLIHTSARYSFKEAKEILEKRLPPEERGRVVLFPGR